MSADNYIYVAKIDGRYAVGMAFASDEEIDLSQRAREWFDDVRAAHVYALKWEREEYIVEYGVSMLGEAWDDYLVAP